MRRTIPGAVKRQLFIYSRTDKKSPEAVEGLLTDRKADRPRAYYCGRWHSENRGAAPILEYEGPRPDGQTSKDPVNRVAPGTRGAGLNPFILVANLLLVPTIIFLVPR